MSEIPDTTYVCDGSGEECSLLANYLQVTVSPKRDVLMSTEVLSDDADGFSENEVYAGTKSGRSVILRFKDFDALATWVAARSGLKPKLEVNREDEIYVPEDNPTEDELAERDALKAGDTEWQS